MTVHGMLTWTTYSGKTADPRWESSSSSMVKPLQLTWRQETEEGTGEERQTRRHKQTGGDREQQGE